MCSKFLWKAFPYTVCVISIDTMCTVFNCAGDLDQVEGDRSKEDLAPAKVAKQLKVIKPITKSKVTKTHMNKKGASRSESLCYVN